MDICLALIEEYVPKMKNESSKSLKPKWMTRELLAQLDKQARAWKRLKARRTPVRAEKYRQERNKANVMVKLTKMVFEIKLCDDIKINSKHFWGFVRSKPNLKERILNVKK